MPALKTAITGIKQPQRTFVELYTKFQRDVLERSGIDIMSQDWDNLIILDACRFDIFKSQHSLQGTLEKAISKGSHTSEFLTKNFASGSFPDTVYISATPQIQNLGVESQFHQCIRLWDDQWDNDLRTVPPAAVKDTALETAVQYPNKRLIIHFLQPHYPFIGPTGQKIEHATITGDGVLYSEKDELSIWELLERGSISKEMVWQAYRENLNIALEHVEVLCEEIDGKTVVTSDHGNSFGRLGVYGHPPGLFLDCLVEVPWLTIDSASRRNIMAEDTTDIYHESDVSDQLNALGYV